MCYAIPAKVVQRDGPTATIDYFGERRRVRNDFYQDLAVGEYVLAQGGLIIRKVAPEEARASLKGWRELFLKLKKKDLTLSRKSKNLYQTANAVRQKYLGNSCCVHGIIEFSNYCRNDCLYCGIRKSNGSAPRYRMSVDEIVNACLYSARELKFKALVLQSGEDLWYTEERLLEVVRRVMALEPMLLILSIGERQAGLYKRLYEAGARGALLRFETSNPVLYKKYRPGYTLEGRLKLIKELKKTGYLVFTGFMVGLPDESAQDIASNIELTHALRPEMFSFGPFLPHP
ncbi:HypC/HybG/HupF family hydrogenase formation chaperone, partial [bacterium]